MSGSWSVRWGATSQGRVHVLHYGSIRLSPHLAIDTHPLARPSGTHPLGPSDSDLLSLAKSLLSLADHTSSKLTKH